jgi:hypothetical protein
VALPVLRLRHPRSAQAGLPVRSEAERVSAWWTGFVVGVFVGVSVTLAYCTVSLIRAKRDD